MCTWNKKQRRTCYRSTGWRRADTWRQCVRVPCCLRVCPVSVSELFASKACTARARESKFNKTWTIFASETWTCRILLAKLGHIFNIICKSWMCVQGLRAKFDKCNCKFFNPDVRAKCLRPNPPLWCVLQDEIFWDGHRDMIAQGRTCTNLHARVWLGRTAKLETNPTR